MFTLRKLSEQEKASPLAGLLEQDTPQPDLSALEAPLPPLEGFWPDTPRGLCDDTARAGSGWCILNNGLGYISVRQRLSGCTKEMVQWMFAWQGTEPLHYTLLAPTLHHSAAVSDVDLEKLLNPHLALELKCLGYTLFSVENMDGDLEDVLTMYTSPADMGMTFHGLYTRDAPVIGGTFIRQTRTELNPQKKWVGIVLHHILPTDGGVDVLTRIWLGCRVLRGELKILTGVSNHPMPKYVQALARHETLRWNEIAHNLPELFRTVGETR